MSDQRSADLFAPDFNHDLFPPLENHHWLPDESVYSWASRFHFRSANALWQTTATQLFGVPQGGFPHDLPGGIDHLVHVTAGRLGTAGEVIRRHTVLPLLVAFRSRRDQNDAVDSMRGPGIGRLKSRLGMLTSRLGAICPLKACPACADADRQQFGTPYWHTTHQLPGVWVCLCHGVLLRVSACCMASAKLRTWELPREGNLVAVDTSSLTTASMKFLRRLAQMAIDVWRRGVVVNFDSEQLVATYRAGLPRPASGGRLKLGDLGEDFLEVMSAVRPITEFSSIAATARDATAQVAKLLRAPRIPQHSLRHLTMIAWLFESWGEFTRAYSKAERKTLESVSSPQLELNLSLRDRARQAQLVSLIRLGKSISRAAKLVGVDTFTAQSWATQNGIECPRRLRRLHGQLRQRLIRRLLRGERKVAAARSENVSLSAVERVLCTEIGLHDKWRAARYARTRAAARRDWLHALRVARGLGPKAARALEPRAWSWLYRNDRLWFDVTNQKNWAVL